MAEASSDSIANVLKAANEAATVARGIYLALMGLAVFLLLVAAGLTDHRLLLNGSVPLPLIEKTELPLSMFFGIGSWLFVLVYAECLMHFLLLSEKLAVFKGAMRGLIASERSRERTQLSNFLFSHWLSAEKPDRIVHFFQSAVVVATLVVLPVAAILYCQLACMPFQSEAVTWSQRLAALACLILLATFWPKIVSPAKSRCQWWSEHVAFLRKRAGQDQGAVLEPGQRHGWIVAILAALTVQVAFVSATIPLEPWERFVLRVNSSLGGSTVLADDRDRLYVYSLLFGGVLLTDKSPREGWLTTFKVDVPQGMSTFATTALLFHSSISPFRRTLTIRGRNLSSAATPSLPFALTAKDDAARKLEDDAIQNVDLRGRRLRFADFTSVAIANVDLRSADLIGAIFRKSAFYDVDLSDATAVGLHLQDSSLVRSKLTRANLKGSHFERVSAKGLVAEEAVFVGARLDAVRLDAAELATAKFDAAFLYDVSLRRATLSRITSDHLVAYKVDFRGAKGLPNDILWNVAIVDTAWAGAIPAEQLTESEAKAGIDDIPGWSRAELPLISPYLGQCVYTKAVGCADRITPEFAMAYVNALLTLACRSSPHELSALALRYRGWTTEEPMRWMPIPIASTREVHAGALMERFDEVLQKGPCLGNDRALVGVLPRFLGRYAAEPAAPRGDPASSPQALTH